MSTIGSRKADHLALCATDEVAFREKTTPPRAGSLLFTTRFGLRSGRGRDRHWKRHALPGKKLRAPLALAAKKGGPQDAARGNRALSSNAQERGYGFGLGSQRAMHLRAEATASYAGARVGADGASSLATSASSKHARMTLAEVTALVQAIGADALCIHLNPAMELVQPGGGDRDFRGGLETIATLVRELPFPVIVKETGCGLSSHVGKKLIAAGVRHVDVSGAGGTSWVGVETKRAEAAGNVHAKALGDALWDWGIPTAASVSVLAPLGFETIIATGGVATGLDVAGRGLIRALGAAAAGIARPALQALVSGGRAGAVSFFEDVEEALRAVMLLTGSANIAALRKAPRVLGSELRAWIAEA